MTTPEAAERRPMRADARRNYERLLTAAREAFAEHGAEFTLEDIARRAGVGIGTLYRHFPTRDALADAVFSEEYEKLTALARHLATVEPPGEALMTWLHTFMVHNASTPGIFKALMHALKADETTRLHSRLVELREAGRALTERAVAAGEVRADADYSDVTMIVCSMARSAQDAGWPAERRDQMFAVIRDGLRPVAAR
ncbi:TetR/AcrR family transcriptional regulator [Catenulispora sp. NF23]|uniref:TetR/AcrR family transcriptional regulator n=1 Tax=Catenulispora pinistramenti TaxID=2705254 RepID=A0ABS5KRG6_9ACTN|nr:TetR/AcrR family transcriptional regulator [Catenulispora pinistramenti]MBS2536050.1 TetR/AcrR family transcriptional regulator [Catenulispora pinistramenti]MBS2548632.1 TetR/AcrR family transcriptional regulator [Catenulispora pinistramenti]